MPELEITESTNTAAVENTATPDAVTEEPGKESGQEETQIESAYTPNYKFKVNNEEKEFDEFIRSSIKDKDTEEKARKLYADAYGITPLKEKYELTAKEKTTLEKEYGSLRGGVEEILSLKDKDLDAFFERVQIPEEKIAQWMLDKLKMQELPPEQRQWYNQLNEARRQNASLQKQLQERETATQEQGVQARTYELDSTLQRPEISAYAAAYDLARKKPGAFREQVIQRGIVEWNVNQRDLATEQAIQETMSILGESYRGNANPLTQTGIVEDKPLPVIPRVSGKSMSPTGKTVKSIADLRKRAAEFNS